MTRRRHPTLKRNRNGQPFVAAAHCFLRGARHEIACTIISPRPLFPSPFFPSAKEYSYDDYQPPAGH